MNVNKDTVSAFTVYCSVCVCVCVCVCVDSFAYKVWWNVVWKADCHTQVGVAAKFW